MTKQETDNFLARIIFGDNLPEETEVQRNQREFEEYLEEPHGK